MPRTKFIAEDTIQILRTIEIEEGKVLTNEEAVRKAGISPASF